ncbi:flagellar hook-basal body complex protein [Roseitranquillus sediminis]|uniref:flagellar hook-basal body complex protein n=1 Tax=Roseitranquillus sediminis TaxID=2809051 RepID=UPI001D0C9ECE|nr:flagellar hook-basal body complex protein [Roseitranquillus sediminis]MBM9596122.1 flagellar hook-basal body complex protein [Roseitranquillus sediminis]
MDNAGYTSLTRQAGLLREMQTVANNIANLSTTGFRREGVVFSEFVKDTGPGQQSLSMAAAHARHVDLSQGTLNRTNGQFDLAIEGDGFFLIEAPEGQQLTRAGAFMPNEMGDLVTAEGHPVLDAGGAPIFIPPDAANVAVASDGTISADGQPVGQIGLWAPNDINDLHHQSGTRFTAEGGVEPMIEGGRILQGYVEGSNVDPVSEIARMIEVSRAYEMGQGFMDKEDERIRSVIRTLGR